jgi:hypothetical protein
MAMNEKPLSGAVLLVLLSALPACPSGGGGSASEATPTKGSTSAAASASPSAEAPAASLSATAAAASADQSSFPVEPAKVAKVVNPQGEAPYSGPTGTLKGVVQIDGDEPPDTPGLKIPAKCNEAAATYGKLFRLGIGRTVADVLVAVTGYKGYVPARDAAVKTNIYSCALGRRTLAVTFGQRIEVRNQDAVDPYMPYLDGAPSKASLVAVPKGDPVKLYPLEPGHYLIRDMLPNDFLRADVYVVAYSTHDVTGLDGRYEIKGIPVGLVAVNALLPAIDRTAANMIDIQPGENTVNFLLRYDKNAKGPAAASAKPAAPKGGGKAAGGSK